jgi:UDP-N-acetylglucosamine:LPS N-acetylglucosamine transferase
LTGDRLAERIAAIAEDAGARRAMSEAAHRLAHPDAAAAIVQRVLELAERAG